MPEQRNSIPSLIDNFVVPVCQQQVQIVYQDDDILLLNKPSGLLSLSGKNPLNWDSVHYRLVHGQPGITPAFTTAKLPHRLDFGTSGLMLVGLNAPASKHLNQQFQARTIKKRYMAMLSGWLAQDEGQISAPIAKDKQLFPRVKLCATTGKTALSDYKVLQRLSEPERTLVQFTPLTGRTHQLRIHSLAINHPILGCDLYHNADSTGQAERLCLHASELSFQHPSSGKQLTIHSAVEF
ncbi:RluA family pseudouridine synthase [Pseudoalteromonas sp.]|uniref:RluA family pseudouridine synthase n=1 Tax=Pseudoalteromonas sp. TaxID=53249 RepID=UPI0035698909